MKEIILKMDSPQEAAQMVLVLFQNGFKPRKAIINYNIRKPPTMRIKKLADYPLILEGSLNGHEMRVAVTPLAIGRYCPGSDALRRILKTAHFYIEDMDLFTLRKFNQETGCAHFTLTLG
ncbi:MAG: hypothetical protein IJE68_03660 [Clostridia bacterium]|nr:hypothetical protein [Clostridia bacterium]